MGGGGVAFAPPLRGGYGYGYGGYGLPYGGGFFGPTIFFSPWGGGLYSLVFNMILLSIAVNFFMGVAKSLTGGGEQDAKDAEDDFDGDEW